MNTYLKPSRFQITFHFGVLMLLSAFSAIAETERELYCSTGDLFHLEPCDPALLQREDLTQFLFLPTGFTSDEKASFIALVDELMDFSSDNDFGLFTIEPFTFLYKDRILYVAAWIPGEDIESSKANFNARLIGTPVRPDELLLKSSSQLIHQEYLNLKSQYPNLKPNNINIIFDTDEGTANATYSGHSIGFDTMGLVNLQKEYIGQTFWHEAGHSTFNWSDEYVEDRLEEINVRILDYLTPLLVVNSDSSSVKDGISSLFSIYDMNFSEILFSGKSNIGFSECPTTVGLAGECGTSAYKEHHDFFNSEGAYFGYGLFKEMEGTIMWGGFFNSDLQLNDMKIFFEGVDPGPNDQLRNAGPLINLPIGIGQVEVMTFDQKKHARYHPTTSYDVEVRWEEVKLGICYLGLIPYPCEKGEKARSVRKNFLAEREIIPLVDSNLNKLASQALPLLCNLLPKFELCQYPYEDLRDSITDFTQHLESPYQKMKVPMPLLGKNHYWRFRTHNGPMCDISCEDNTIEECSDCSGWTNFSSL